MSADHWKKWTPEVLRHEAEQATINGFNPWGSMLHAFAALLEAEQRGARCVLPQVFDEEELSAWESINGDHWIADCRSHKQGKGETKEAAILDLARKLRGDK